jgi:L-alanine-DL-glutamate epimerase and related enzymes of enolase superfamily
MSSDTTIVEISTRFLSIPLEKPLLTAAFPIPAIDTALVEVRTAGGASGVAWSFAFGRGKVASLVRLIQDLSTLAVGEDALMVGRLWEKLVKSTGFIGPRGLAAAAISTIDTACWDIIGVTAGLPVYQLLGGHSDRVETYASQGLWLDRSRDALADEARELVESGFGAVKMRAGLADEDEDVARIRAVREAIGPDRRLMVDVNQAWNLKQTLRMAQRLEEFDLFWLEEPMPFQRVDDYVAATAAMSMPMCTGESNYYKDEILELAQRRATDFVMPDLMRMGGVTEWMKATRTCESLGATVTPHLFMEHSAHLAAASPNVVWQEYQPWWQPIMVHPVELVDGSIKLSDRPGFGIELDTDAVAAFEVQ